MAAFCTWMCWFSATQYTQLWRFILLFSLNVASLDQTVLFTNSTTSCTLYWNHSQNCISQSGMSWFVARINPWDVNSPFSILYNAMYTWSANFCLKRILFCGLLCWSYELLQHCTRRGGVRCCARLPRSFRLHTMHCTIGLKFVMNVCSC